MSEYKNKSELAFEKEVIEYLTHIGGVCFHCVGEF
mgnify:CR=1 FL=1